MAKNERNSAVEKLLESQKSLEEMFTKMTQDSINNILGKSIRESMNKAISESEEGTFEEIEDETIKTSDEENDSSNDMTSIESGEEENILNTDNEEGIETEETFGEEDVETEDDNSKIWDELESYKDSDGEYDLRGMETEKVVHFMNILKPKDGIRIIKNPDGTASIPADSVEQEIVLVDDDPTNDCEGGECLNDEELTSESKNEFNIHQDKTAMETPSNPGDTTNKSETHGLGTEPTGNERRFNGKVGDGQPYDLKEEEIVEHGGQGGQATRRNITKTQDGSSFGPARNTSDKGTGEAPTNGVHESVQKEINDLKRQVNDMYKQNKKLKDLSESLKKNVIDCIIVNKNLGNIIKLISENTTSVNEKRDIIKKFSEVKSLKQSDDLCKMLSENLRRQGRDMQMQNAMKSQIVQLTESKEDNTSEEPMFQKESISKTLSLIKRMDGLGKKTINENKQNKK